MCHGLTDSAKGFEKILAETRPTLFLSAGGEILKNSMENTSTLDAVVRLAAGSALLSCYTFIRPVFCSRSPLKKIDKYRACFLSCFLYVADLSEFRQRRNRFPSFSPAFLNLVVNSMLAYYN
jgi:hypothetical protein